MLDERRTQLSDLRRHLEKESSENGALEAVVRHRASRNGRGADRLRELDLAFEGVLAGERLLDSRASGLAADLAAFAAEHRRVRRRVGRAAADLGLAERSLRKRERTLALGREESGRLDAGVRRRRLSVAEREALLRGAQEKASREATLAREVAQEAAALGGEVAGLRRGLAAEETGSAEATAALAALKEQAAEVGGTCTELSAGVASVDLSHACRQAAPLAFVSYADPARASTRPCISAIDELPALDHSRLAPSMLPIARSVILAAVLSLARSSLAKSRFAPPRNERRDSFPMMIPRHRRRPGSPTPRPPARRS